VVKLVASIECRATRVAAEEPVAVLTLVADVGAVAQLLQISGETGDLCLGEIRHQLIRGGNPGGVADQLDHDIGTQRGLLDRPEEFRGVVHLCEFGANQILCA